MPASIIEARGLSKRYRLGQIGLTSLGEELSRLWQGTRRRARTSPTNTADSEREFWALREVSFSVAAGDAIGIIGRNGAGKSTLLKLLSRITEPAAGEIVLRGRVASLLEVGTGFHPDLSGRENVFLNGAILGMSRAEIRRKFDEVVAFAGVERFLDTPVKRYSSGMYVRLAFAVAAHLEPEILIVDEVLAVGDEAFQRKCLGKMGSVGREGRTVLFVSHNLAAVRSLCQRALLLDAGRLVADGSSDVVTRRYAEEATVASELPLTHRTDRTGTGAVRFTAVALLGSDGEAVGAFHTGEDATLRLKFDNFTAADLQGIHIGVGIDNVWGERVFTLNNQVTRNSPSTIPLDAEGVDVEIKRLPLPPGQYTFTLYFAIDGSAADWIQHAGTFNVDPGDYFGTGKQHPNQGHVFVDHRFSIARTATTLPAAAGR